MKQLEMQCNTAFQCSSGLTIYNPYIYMQFIRTICRICIQNKKKVLLWKYLNRATSSELELTGFCCVLVLSFSRLNWQHLSYFVTAWCSSMTH